MTINFSHQQNHRNPLNQFAFELLTKLNQQNLVSNRETMKLIIETTDHLLAKRDFQIYIVWTKNDVMEQANRQGIELNENDCIEILESIENNYDANLGVTWETVDVGIENHLSS